MRRLLLWFWLTLPVVAAAYHQGPGQWGVRLDNVAMKLSEADELRRNGDLPGADQAMGEALQLLPEGHVRERRRILLERAKLQVGSGDLTGGHSALKSLVAEMDLDSTTDASQSQEARAALANSRFYLTWLMRLEGRPREEWELEIESARQTYTRLSEQANSQGDSQTALAHQRDLEAAVRLSRMDLGELQGLPLPKQ